MNRPLQWSTSHWLFFEHLAVIYWVSSAVGKERWRKQRSLENRMRIWENWKRRCLCSHEGRPSITEKSVLVQGKNEEQVGMEVSLQTWEGSWYRSGLVLSQEGCVRYWRAWQAIYRDLVFVSQITEIRLLKKNTRPTCDHLGLPSTGGSSSWRLRNKVPTQSDTGYAHQQHTWPTPSLRAVGSRTFFIKFHLEVLKQPSRLL